MPVVRDVHVCTERDDFDNDVGRVDPLHDGWLDAERDRGHRVRGADCRPGVHDDPASWRAWDGSGFNLRLTSPYATGASATVCTYLPDAIGNSSLSYNTYLGIYMLVNDSNTGGGASCGIYFSLSPDMVHWGPMQMIAPARIPWCDAGPATPGVLEPVMVLYPSLLDHADTGVNFDRTGRTVYLYYTRFNDGGLDRDLVRVPVTFSLE